MHMMNFYLNTVVVIEKSADFMNNSGHLGYSRVEVAADSVAKSAANVAFLFQAKG
jgi:hypothetical protein